MKSITIAIATAKETIRQPSFFVIAFFAAALLVATIFVPYFTFGEDIKMLKDSGFSLIMVLCLIMSIWSAHPKTRSCC